MRKIYERMMNVVTVGVCFLIFYTAYEYLTKDLPSTYLREEFLGIGTFFALIATINYVLLGKLTLWHKSESYNAEP